MNGGVDMSPSAVRTPRPAPRAPRPAPKVRFLMGFAENPSVTVRSAPRVDYFAVRFGRISAILVISVFIRLRAFGELL